VLSHGNAYSNTVRTTECDSPIHSGTRSGLGQIADAIQQGKGVLRIGDVPPPQVVAGRVKVDNPALRTAKKAGPDFCC